MQLASVVLARIFALFPIEDLNPKGMIYYPEVVQWLVGRFGFQKYPTKPEDFDEAKGIEFHAGKAGEYTIEKVAILDTGIYLDTMASTDISEQILRETLEAAKTDLGLYFHDEMLKRRAYISQLAFYSDASLFLVHPLFRKIAETVTREVQETFGKSLPYEPSILTLNYDPTTTQLGPAPFSIQRREKVPYSEKKFFSVAPTRTRVHIDLLEQIETLAEKLSKGAS